MHQQQHCVHGSCPSPGEIYVTIIAMSILVIVLLSPLFIVALESYKKYRKLNDGIWIFSIIIRFINYIVGFFLFILKEHNLDLNEVVDVLAVGDVIKVYNKSTKKNEIMLVIDVQKNLLRVTNMDDMNFTESEISDESHEFVRRIKY